MFFLNNSGRNKATFGLCKISLIPTNFLSFRYKTTQSREDRAERGGARERTQRRRVHPGAPRRRRVQRQRLGIRERVRQRGMGRAREQSGVTQLRVIRRCYCLLGKRPTINSFRCSDRYLNILRRFSFRISVADISLSRNRETLACFKRCVLRIPNFLD